MARGGIQGALSICQRAAGVLLAGNEVPARRTSFIERGQLIVASMELRIRLAKRLSFFSPAPGIRRRKPILLPARYRSMG